MAKKNITGKMLEIAARDAKGIGLLVASPVIGNFSDNLRKRIENEVGSERFTADLSGKISSISNLFVYPWMVHQTTHNGWLTAGAFAYSLIERAARNDKYNDSGDYPASLPGKLASYPVEYGVNLHDRAAEELGN